MKGKLFLPLLFLASVSFAQPMIKTTGYLTNTIDTKVSNENYNLEFGLANSNSIVQDIRIDSLYTGDSVYVDITVMNTGDSLLKISGVKTNTKWAIASYFPSKIAPRKLKTFTFLLTNKKQEGDFDIEVSIASNAKNNPYTFHVKGSYFTIPKLPEVVSFWPNGARKAIGNNSTDAIWHFYDVNDSFVLDGKGQYLNGIQCGPWEENTPDGLHTMVTYNHGVREGAYKTLYNSGGTYYEGIMKNDQPVGIWKFYYPSGKLMKEESFNDSNYRDGRWTWYYDNGKVSKTGTYKNGLEEGVWKANFRNGRPMWEGNAVHGDLDGLWTYYYENGHKRAQGNYKAQRDNASHSETEFGLDGTKTGIWHYWDKDEKIIGTEKF